MNAPRPLRDVLGERIRHLREAAGLRQEDLARTARGAGLAWPRSKVTALERGEKAISAEELLLVPAVLAWALDRAVTWRDLFDVDGDIELTDRVRIAARDVPRYLALPVAEFLTRPAPTQGAAWEQIRPRCAELGIRTRPAGFAEVLEASGEAERRAAARVGERPEVYAAVSARLWGRTMSAERDARVDADPPADAAPARLQALRGRVSRQLDEEVRGFVGRAKG